MTKTDILRELPKSTPEAQREVVTKVHEIGGDDWLVEGESSVQEKVVPKARQAEHDRNPRAALVVHDRDAVLFVARLDWDSRLIFRRLRRFPQIASAGTSTSVSHPHAPAPGTSC